MGEQQLEEWGAHCTQCKALDFLPFKCQHCKQLFCSDHYKTLGRPADDGHACPQYDENKVDARVPSCPLCGAAVSIPKGVDPNIPMDSHLTSACPVLNSSTGLAHDGVRPAAKPPKPANVCHYSRCSTKMIVKMRCPECAYDFCTPHRFPKDHACKAGSSNHSSGRSTPTQVDPQRRAALAAVKRALRSSSVSGKTVTPKVAPKATAPPPASSSSQAGSRGNPIVLDDAPAGNDKSGVRIPKLGLGKVDRRAKAEEESRRKALETRARKGLLTEQEKVLYATEIAEAHSRTNRKDDCTVC